MRVDRRCVVAALVLAGSLCSGNPPLIFDPWLDADAATCHRYDDPDSEDVEIWVAEFDCDVDDPSGATWYVWREQNTGLFVEVDSGEVPEGYTHVTSAIAYTGQLGSEVSFQFELVNNTRIPSYQYDLIEFTDMAKPELREGATRP